MLGVTTRRVIASMTDHQLFRDCSISENPSQAVGILLLAGIASHAVPIASHASAEPEPTALTFGHSRPEPIRSISDAVHLTHRIGVDMHFVSTHSDQSRVRLGTDYNIGDCCIRNEISCNHIIGHQIVYNNLV